MAEPKWPRPWQRGSVQSFNREHNVYHECPTEAVVYAGGSLEAEEDDEIEIKIEGPAAHAVADLVTAAPDLYEALAHLVSNLDQSKLAGSWTSMAEARAALAKARGEP